VLRRVVHFFCRHKRNEPKKKSGLVNSLRLTTALKQHNAEYGFFLIRLLSYNQLTPITHLLINNYTHFYQAASLKKQFRLRHSLSRTSAQPQANGGGLFISFVATKETNQRKSPAL